MPITAVAEVVVTCCSLPHDPPSPTAANASPALGWRRQAARPLGLCWRWSGLSCPAGRASPRGRETRLANCIQRRRQEAPRGIMAGPATEATTGWIVQRTACHEIFAFRDRASWIWYIVSLVQIFKYSCIDPDKFKSDFVIGNKPAERWWCNQNNLEKYICF